jgi:hypothetical protein
MKPTWQKRPVRRAAAWMARASWSVLAGGFSM